MKKIFISTFLTLLAITSFGQYDWQINFDPPYYLYVHDQIVIDTVSTSNCKWQVGKPVKTSFNSAYSFPNAIVTDTLYTVPPNDTSIFYIKHAKSYDSWDYFVLHFMYRMDGDSTDKGIIEISPDTGNTWINLLTQDSIFQFNWITPKPTLTGSTIGWQSFDLDMNSWGNIWGTFPILITADTVIFKFTYITDSASAPHDGWMLDNFHIEDWTEGILDFSNGNLFSIYPNPVSDKLTVSRTKSNDILTIQIFNYSGQVLYDNKNFIDEYIETSQLKNGVYLLKYSDSKSYSIKKFIVIH